jgi:methylthioribose-1-phosphate isomerase
LHYINKKLDYLMDSRPTAVDLSNAIRLLKVTVNVAALADNNDQVGLDGGSSKRKADAAGIRKAYIHAAEKILEDDLTTNLAIGRYGAEYLRRQQMPITFTVDQSDEWRYFTTSPPGTQGAPDRTYRKLSVLTHCNTGYAICILHLFYACFDTYRLVGLLQLRDMEQLSA